MVSNRKNFFSKKNKYLLTNDDRFFLLLDILPINDVKHAYDESKGSEFEINHSIEEKIGNR